MTSIEDTVNPLDATNAVNDVGPTKEEQFQAERKLGFGGSDAAKYMGVGKYGCTRAIVYDKAGVAADYPFNGNDATERGTLLEDPTGKLYALKTGRKIRRRTWQDVDKVSDYLRLHVDRHIISGPQNIDQDGNILPGPGVLEIKTMNERAYRRFLEYGVPPQYAYQLQHALMVTGYQWGSFAVYWPDGNQIRNWDVYRDEKLIAEMREKAAWAWGRVVATRDAIRRLEIARETGMSDADIANCVRGVEAELPERLPAWDERCKVCSYRTTCQGGAIDEKFGDGFDKATPSYDESLTEIVREHKRLKAETAPKLVRIEEIERDLRIKMDDRLEAVCSAGKVTYKPQRRGKARFRVLKVF